MKTKLFLLFLASVLFLQSSCEDNDCPTYKLPNATQTGDNTIGCLLDGNVCIPKSTLFGGITKRLCYNEQTGKMSFMIYFIESDIDLRCGIPRMSVYFGAENIVSTGVTSEFWASTFIDYNPNVVGGQQVRYYGNDPNYAPILPEISGIDGQLEITKLDRTNRIISGRFRFIAVALNDYTSKTYFTEGRFDIKYNADGSCIEGCSN
jgi:hypothetical protein